MAHIDASRGYTIGAFVIDRLRTFFGIHDWRISWDFARPETPGWIASVAVNATYKRADIIIDLQSHATELALVETVRHELIHILIGDIKLIRSHAHALFGGKPAKWSPYERISEIAEERMVVRLEFMLDKAGYSPAELLARVDAPGEPPAETSVPLDPPPRRPEDQAENTPIPETPDDAGTTRVRSLSTDSAAAQGMDGSSCPPGLAPGQPTGGGPVP